MEVISSIYNSGYNIKKFYLGSRELNLAYLGNQVIYDEVIGDNDLNYILYEFYGSDTLPNTVEAPVKSAILKGSTKYRDIDTGEFLETFEEGRNLELVSVKMPVLKTQIEQKNLFDGEFTIGSMNPSGFSEEKNRIRATNYIPVEPLTIYTITSFEDFNIRYVVFYNEDKIGIGETNFNSTKIFRTTTPKNTSYIMFNCAKSNTNSIFNESEIINKKVQVEKGQGSTSFIEYQPYKSNILTVNEDVTLRSNGDICDELNLLTGQLAQRIGEDGVVLSQEVVKTVDLTIVDQDGKTINKLNSFNGTTYVSTEVAENSTYPMVSLEVASELQAAMSKVAEDIELIKPVQNDIETTIDTQSNDIDSLLLATTELFEMFL